MGDYPDYTTLMQIVGSDITVPIEIKAVTVTHIDVDIAAQTIGNLAVNIAASAITLNVAIASSAVTLNVDITAQTLTDFKITVNAQNVGIYLQPDWQVKAGTDKNLQGGATVQAGNYAFVLDYTVTPGKTFYICQWGFNIYWNSGVVAWLEYRHDNTDTILSASGGMSGNAQSFTKPIVVVAGDHIKVRIDNFDSSNHSGNASVGGYEI